MKGQVGDEIVVDSLRTGAPPREGEILEVKTTAGTLLYRVRWDDGRESTFCPGSTAHVVRLAGRRGARHR